MENTNENRVPQEEVKTIDNAVSTTGKTDIAKNKKMFLYGLSAFVAVVIIFIGIFGFVRVRAGATDGFTYYSAKFMHLPLMSVDGQKIAYVDYLDDMEAIKTMKNYEKESNAGVVSDLTEEQMSDQVVWRLANNAMVSQIAKKFDVKVEKKDIEDLKTQVLQQFKSEEELENELIKRYGWNLKLYETKVIRPFVLQSKVSEKIQTDKDAINTVLSQADEVLEKIKNGASFEEMAQLYGSDGTKDSGGDLGWFGKGEMVAQFENAVFALKKGQLSETLVETEFGYHIVKVTDTKTERVKDESGKWVNEQKVRASHILFRFPIFEQYMDDYLKKVQIKFYSKIHNPFKNDAEAPLANQ